MKTKEMKTNIRKIWMGFLLILILTLICIHNESLAKTTNDELDLYSESMSVKNGSTEIASTDLTSEIASTTDTLPDSEDDNKDNAVDLTAPYATVIGAGLALISASIGALISFLNTVYVQHRQRENQREERKEAIELETMKNKKNVYYDYLKKNKTVYNQLLDESNSEDKYKSLIEELNEPLVWIEIYGCEEIIKSAHSLLSYLEENVTNPEEYYTEYNRFLKLVKEDLKVYPTSNTDHSEKVLNGEKTKDNYELTR